MHSRALYFWGHMRGVFKLRCVIICPYSEPAQVALVQTIGNFCDFSDLYHQIYESNLTS